MSTTQHNSTIPMSLATCSAKGSVQWLLERKEDEPSRVTYQNNLQVYICGEETFAKIAEDIQHAKHSIDIICWGFDPAMELTRDKARSATGQCACSSLR